jgi:hypothetical protein
MNTILQRWAERAGYRIVHQERRYLRTGPFLLTARGQQVFYVTVEGAVGGRSGYVRCGHWFWGVWSDAAEVHWQDPGEFGEPSPQEASCETAATRKILLFAILMGVFAAAGVLAALAARSGH